MNAHLRVARPTDRLEASVTMYREGLGLDLLDSFEDLDGYRVVIQNANWMND